MTARDAMLALSRLAREMGEARDRDDVLRRAASAVFDMVHPDLLIVYRREGDTLRPCEVLPGAMSGMLRDTTPHRVGECLCGLAVAQRAFVSSEDIFHDPRCVRKECKGAGFRSFAATPVHVEGEVAAVLGFAARRRRDFARQRDFMEALAAQVGVGLSNAMLRRCIEERLDDTQARLIEDRTEARRAENRAAQLHDELMVVTRVSALGEMAASLAHELSQPLAATTTNAATALVILERACPDPATLREVLQAIVRDTDRASTMIRRLRDFLRRGEEGRLRAPLELPALVGEVLAMLRPRIAAEGIEVTEQYAAALPRVYGDKAELQQAILNLVTNAMDAVSAIEGSKMLRLCARAASRDRAVELVVSDNGPGFDPASIGHASSPFVTTKPDGLGLGLPICKRIVESHGGGLRLGRAPGGGAEVVMTLPTGREP